LHGCRVGNNCLIGMGAILLDGCEIGDNFMIGAGSLVGPGRRIPAGSLAVGSPAKVIRKLSAEDLVNIRGFSDRYVALQARYRTGALKPV
ncbi:MAG TPA: gamma carbonic anhydrase family protein, partial [Pontiella sp.]|nr:gamma carbonic anhydrase family protein [Pontiella sp.]